MIKKILFVAALGTLATIATAAASHIPGRPCNDCASHAHWPTIHGKVKKADHAADVPRHPPLGRAARPPRLGQARRPRALGRPVGRLGRRRPADQPARPHLRRRGNDFIYGSHGRNVIYGGPGNDAISVHYGRGFVDCGPGRDIYHVATVAPPQLQGPQLRAGRLPQRGPARRRAEAPALARGLVSATSQQARTRLPRGASTVLPIRFARSPRCLPPPSRPSASAPPTACARSSAAARRIQPGSARRLAAALLAAALLCLWDLTTPATRTPTTPPPRRSASESWKAWFFGSLDPGSFITVDKPPLSLWLMGLSARVLGFSSFSHPAARRRCARSRAVGLLYATVRRAFGARRGRARRRPRWRSRRSRWRSAASTTPTRCSCCCSSPPPTSSCGRSSPAARSTWCWAALLVGLAFMTKMLQGWMVVPALAAAYLLAGPAAAARPRIASCSSPAWRWSP